MIIENTSGITPLEYYVLVKLDTIAEKTQGGIWIPDDTRQQKELAQISGRIIAIGPLAFLYDVHNSTIPDIGDRVAFPKYSGLAPIGKDKGEYRLIKDGDIAAILAE